MLPIVVGLFGLVLSWSLLLLPLMLILVVFAVVVVVVVGVGVGVAVVAFSSYRTDLCVLLRSPFIWWWGVPTYLAERQQTH